MKHKLKSNQCDLSKKARKKFFFFGSKLAPPPPPVQKKSAKKRGEKFSNNFFLDSKNQVINHISVQEVYNCGLFAGVVEEVESEKCGI